MKTYKYQMHMHTLPCSACAKTEPKAFVKTLYGGGYRGGVITNHFLHGNTGIDRTLPWADFVRPYAEDYLLFKNEAKKYGLDIFFGLEQGVGNGLEILCYGLTPEILYSHPELKASDPKIWYRVLHENNCLVIQAHPFRERDYIKEATPLPLEIIDGIEVFNAGNTLKNNMKAEEFAKAHPELILVSGGDAHHQSTVCCGGIETAAPLTSEADVADILRRGAYNLLTDK